MDGLPKLTAGLDGAIEYPLREVPAEGIGENYGFWFFEDGGGFAYHTHLETVPGLFDLRREMVQFQFIDGRILYDWQIGPCTSPQGPGGACSTTSCVSPFEKWELRYRGLPQRAEGETMSKEPLDDRGFQQEAAELFLDIQPAADPWIQGALSTEGAVQMKGQLGTFIGGFRYEQLFRATGTLTIDGATRTVVGTGLRTHRVGNRDLGNWIGHIWQTALFPSGRGFGWMGFCNPDGTLNFFEGFVLDGTNLSPAKFNGPAHIHQPQFTDEHFDISVESKFGKSTISCRTMAIHHWTSVSDASNRRKVRYGVDRGKPTNYVLSNGAAVYDWEGESGCGLVERSGLVRLFK